MVLRVSSSFTAAGPNDAELDLELTGGADIPGFLTMSAIAFAPVNLGLTGLTSGREPEDVFPPDNLLFELAVLETDGIDR